MQAWVFKTTGKPKDVLRKIEDWPKPEPTGTQVLIKIHAIALNPFGAKTMSIFPFSSLSKLPCIPEADFSGTIEGGALDGTGFSIGDEVFGQVPFTRILKNGQGVLAEYTLIDPELLATKPKNLSWEEAAAVPVAYLTAINALEFAGLKRHQEDQERQRVFVNGGSGGVGIFAVQIAKLYGAYAVTTCSNESKLLVESLMPDAMINYREVDLSKYLAEHYAEKPFDLIFDTVGGADSLFSASPKYLKAGAMYADIASLKFDGSIWAIIKAIGTFFKRSALPTLLGGTPRKWKFVGRPEDAGPRMKQVAEYLEAGSIKVIIDSVYSFEDVQKAYERSMSARAKGKVVVKIIA